MNKNEYKSYLITLTPLENFFFGSRKNSEPEKKKDYYIKSQYFPQQTAVLGMLRQELLIQNKLFPLCSENRDKAVNLIGEKSFDPEEKEQNFGAIEGISLVLIYKDDHFFHSCPKDLGMTLQTEGGKVYLNVEDKRESKIILMKDFDSRKRPPDLMIANNSCEENLTYDKVFINNEQVGIKKGKSGQTDKESYYKQVYLRMRKGFSYAFFLSLRTEYDSKPVVLKDNIICMGGEQSAFKMELTEVSEQSRGENLKKLFAKTLPDFAEEKVILYSDAFVDNQENQLLKLCKFAVTESIYFRNIRTNVRNTKKFYNLKPRDEESEKTPYLGKRYNLLKRGSVFYVGDEGKDLEKIEKCLNKPHFQKIGYNYYKIYSKKNGYKNLSQNGEKKEKE